MTKLLGAFLILVCQNNWSQDTIRTNPILFAEVLLGYGGSVGDFGGFLYGGNVNFQFGKNLLTARYVENPEFKYQVVSSGTVGFPVFESRIKNTEWALLYGRRHAKDGASFSFSGGISKIAFRTKYFSDDQTYEHTTDHLGFAYEINVKLFKRKKTRHRIYGVFPVGRPTAFGRSIGLKLLGNFSEHSHLGFALTYGFGWHRYY